MTALSHNAQKVQIILDTFGWQLQVLELPDSTRTAQEAADALGCQIGQIVKSLIFRRKHSGAPLLVAASGANRVNEKQIKSLINEPLGKADADFVRQQTGFPIGGVPPVGHDKPIETIIDQDLHNYEYIWAAAGTPHAVFRLTPQQLVHITKGCIAKIV